MLDLDNQIEGRESAVSYRKGQAIGEPIDMILGNRQRENVAYIVEQWYDEASKANVAAPIGTAFFVSMRLRHTIPTYIVTCRHVIESGNASRLAIRLNRDDGECVDIPCPAGEWTMSKESDVAVSRFTRDPRKKCRIGQVHFPGMARQLSRALDRMFLQLGYSPPTRATNLFEHLCVAA